MTDANGPTLRQNDPSYGLTIQIQGWKKVGSGWAAGPGVGSLGRLDRRTGTGGIVGWARDLRPRGWGSGYPHSLGRPGDDTGGEVEEVSVDLAQVPHLVLQLSHPDPQLVLATQHVLGRSRGSEAEGLQTPGQTGYSSSPVNSLVPHLLPLLLTLPTFSIVLHITVCSCSNRSR